MILIDDDPHEATRTMHVKRLAAGIPVLNASNLPVDVAFYGRGESGANIGIGLEVKRADDMADSVIRSGRLMQQFRNATEYGLSRLYLAHEGIVRPSPVDGILEKFIGRGNWKATEPPIEYRRWDNFLSTLGTVLNIQVKRTSDAFETAYSIVNLYYWWQKPPEEHGSWAEFYRPVLLSGKVPLARRVVKELDGVGWTRSLAFQKEFAGENLLDMLSADVNRLKKVEGVGDGIANSIWGTVREEIPEPPPG